MTKTKTNKNNDTIISCGLVNLRRDQARLSQTLLRCYSILLQSFYASRTIGLWVFRCPEQYRTAEGWGYDSLYHPMHIIQCMLYVLTIWIFFTNQEICGLRQSSPNNIVFPLCYVLLMDRQPRLAFYRNLNWTNFCQINSQPSTRQDASYYFWLWWKNLILLHYYCIALLVIYKAGS